MTRPLAIDLFCGVGGWTDGLLSEGYRCVGFDLERHVYGDHAYPAQLVLQDVLTLHGAQFKDAALIVASPPCQKFSHMAMPWSRSKQIAAEYRSGVRDVKQLTALFDACFRIQREAIEAAGHFIPLVVENVCGAQKWVGRARWHWGSFYLWGDVPALMPMTAKRHVKVPGLNWHKFAETGQTSPAFCNFNYQQAERAAREAGVKVGGLDWSKHAEPDYRTSGAGGCFRDSAIDAGVKHHGSGPIWFDTGPAALSSKSPKRKAASALIAKIPLTLARHIAASWKPDVSAEATA